ncbi:hypothetical protein PbDSM24746_51530 [Paenibacillus macerans]|uniref:Uncharacterized protein n=1 Tax=Paenibacillus macerans TaxID=44252 RepID=A0A090ZC60_PAEMA|nr:hypothetical protein [Paenibacillus macerans]KFN07805.1 hypothetical protein DJ90_3885 [Paenibacillus macerans]MBS5914750.1 hypothetical protein [Paenibacillus macerans]OMG48684.1 hypothetical protein BK140_14975 [Paenibacillus macerans]GBK65149.1 hypothetical protein PbDSM24746_51530 [Paenibacillus macerans]GBK71472.1 hypothetical protein PbJCM17693_51800 [Paenibacillus macerans]
MQSSLQGYQATNAKYSRLRAKVILGQFQQNASGLTNRYSQMFRQLVGREGPQQTAGETNRFRLQPG